MPVTVGDDPPHGHKLHFGARPLIQQHVYTMVGLSRRGGAAVLLGFVLLAGGIAGHELLVDGSPRTATAASVAFPVAFAAVVLGYLYRVGRRPDGETPLGAAALGALSMAGLFLLVAESIIWGQQVQGVTVASPLGLISEMGLAGALVGLALGHVYGRVVAGRRRIERREQRLQVLSRVLRHNIRNDLQVARANVETAAGRAEEPVGEELSAALRAIDDLLETAETARNVRATLEETATRDRELVAVVEELADRAATRYPEAEVVLDTPPAPVGVRATDGLTEGLWALVANACEHGGDPVSISVRPDEDGATVEISDRGPGIPDGELAVLEAAEETPLEHGSGLGLWTAHWTVENSGGRLTFRTDEGTTARVRLPAAEGSGRLDSGTGADTRPGTTERFEQQDRPV
jgi:signal transduction histidine kinase